MAQLEVWVLEVDSRKGRLSPRVQPLRFMELRDGKGFRSLPAFSLSHPHHEIFNGPELGVFLSAWPFLLGREPFAAYFPCIS